MGQISDYDRPKKASFIKVRYLIALMATLCPVVCYISRQNLSMAIVAMVHEDEPIKQHQDHSSDSHAKLVLNSSSSPPMQHFDLPPNNASATNTGSINTENTATVAYETCPKPLLEFDSDGKQTTEASLSYGPRYHWSSSQQSLVLGAFFWTYVIFQIPAARFAEQIGAKWVLAAATLGSTLLSLISPLAASKSVYALFLVRALMGVCQTALYPACYVLYSHWLPPLERSQALPILCVGAYLGSIIASTSTGFFIQQETFGWEWAFYMPSLLCALWSLCWISMGSSEPREHRTISLEELDYIDSRMEVKSRHSISSNNNDRKLSASTGSVESASQQQQQQPQQKKQISWSKLLRSQHVWALNCAMFASNWSFSIVLLLLPSYLNDVLHVEPLKNGMINSTIYILYCLASPIVGSVSTLMVETRAFGLSRLNIRKLFQGIALFGQAVCFAAIPLIGCNTQLVMVVLFVQIVLFSFVNGGEVQLPTELSVDFAGTIYAIGNCVGSSTGFIVPAVRSFIVEDSHNRAQWNTYFYVAATVTSIGAIIFMLFGKNDLQDYSADGGNGDESLSDSTKYIYKSSSKHQQFNLEETTTTAVAVRQAAHNWTTMTRQQQKQQQLEYGSWKPRKEFDSLDVATVVDSCSVNNSDNTHPPPSSNKTR